MSFPHPVLGAGMCYSKEIETSDVQLSVNQDDAKNFKFLILLNQPSKNIQSLIDKNLAEYLIEVDCSDTFLRFAQSARDKVITLNIPKKHVYNEVDFSCSIVVKCDTLHLEDKYNEWHSDFQGLAFDLVKSEPLAIYPTVKFPVNLKFERLYAAGSYIQVDKTDKAMSWVELNEDKILIMLPETHYKKFDRLHTDRRFATNFRASMIFNALFFALHFVSEDQYKNKLWAKCICQRVQSEKKLKEYEDVLTGNTTEARIFALAQLMLDDPYGALLDILNKL